MPILLIYFRFKLSLFFLQQSLSQMDWTILFKVLSKREPAHDDYRFGKQQKNLF